MQPSEDNMPGEMVPLHGGKSAESTDLGVADAHATSAFTARRDQIEHEDNLIGMRINWLVAAETFLFVAYRDSGKRGIVLSPFVGWEDKPRL